VDRGSQRQVLGQSQTPFGGCQKQGAAIRCDASAVKRSVSYVWWLEKHNGSNVSSVIAGLAGEIR
jgi:hypothetical protein